MQNGLGKLIRFDSFVPGNRLSPNGERPMRDDDDGEMKRPRWKSFFIQFNVTHAGMALGFSAYSSLMRTLAMYGKIPGIVATCMWYVGVVVALTVFGILALRLLFYKHLMRHDFNLSLRTPFFTAPAIVSAALTASSPPEYRSPLALRIAFGILLLYQTIFALYYYARWLFSSRDTLRKARATLFMSTTEFFVLGYLGALVGFDELGRISLSIGLLFWGIILVAFFQFLSIALGTDKPTPTMFLLIAPPASTAIAHMQLNQNAGKPPLDDFTWFFVGITLFFYLMLIRLFRQYWTGVFRVNWWAYIFPLSTAANLATRMANQINSTAVWVLAYAAVVVATFMLLMVTCLTIHAAVCKKIPYDKSALKFHGEWEQKEAGYADDTPPTLATTETLFGHLLGGSHSLFFRMDDCNQEDESEAETPAAATDANILDISTTRTVQTV